MGSTFLDKILIKCYNSVSFSQPRNAPIEQREEPMETGMYILVSIAAVLYISGQLQRIVSEVLQSRTKEILAQLESLHKKSGEAVKMPFDLWWEDGQRQKAALAMREKALESMPEDMRAMMPEEVLNQMVAFLEAPILESLYDAAAHVAIHANIGNDDITLMRKLPKAGGIQQVSMQDRAEHLEELNGERHFLMSHGIDTEEIEKRFAR